MDGRIRLQMLVDRTTLEVYADGGLRAMTYCFVPTAADAHLALFAEGAPARIITLDVFEVRSIWESAAE